MKVPGQEANSDSLVFFFCFFFSIFYTIIVCCVFSLESPQLGDSNEYTLQFHDKIRKFHKKKSLNIWILELSEEFLGT